MGNFKKRFNLNKVSYGHTANFDKGRLENTKQNYSLWRGGQLNPLLKKCQFLTIFRVYLIPEIACNRVHHVKGKGCFHNV